MSEKICLNCRYMFWAVALGQGVRCTALENRKDDKYMPIPNRNYSCAYFEAGEFQPPVAKPNCDSSTS